MPQIRPAPQIIESKVNQGSQFASIDSRESSQGHQVTTVYDDAGHGMTMDSQDKPSRSYNLDLKSINPYQNAPQEQQLNHFVQFMIQDQEQQRRANEPNIQIGEHQAKDGNP